MVEKAITLQEEVVVYDGRNMPDGYIRDYSQSPPGLKTPPVKEGGEETQFAAIDKPGGWVQFTYKPTYKQQKQGGDYIAHILIPGNRGGNKASGLTIVYLTKRWLQCGMWDLVIND